MLKKTILVLAVFIVLFSCGDDTEGGESGTTDNFDREVMLIHLADNIIIPAFEDFQNQVTTLKEASGNFTASPNEATLVTLQAAWFNAYKTWQYVEMFNIGKAEELLFANFINIYPASETDIENNILSNGDYDLTHPNNQDAQGFPALDYLLFGIGTTNTEIVAKFTTEDNATGYVTYLTDVVERLDTITTEIVTDWNGTFRDEFVNSSGNTATSSVNKLVNDFIFYYEKGLRANKFGIPAGVFSTDALPDRVEAFYRQDISKELALEALNAVEDFFNGKAYNGTTSTSGFKAYLSDLDRDDLVSSITSQIAVARTAINDLDDNFSEQITTDNTKMTMAYDELQKVVVLLKVDMLQAFDISVDFIDADGD